MQVANIPKIRWPWSRPETEPAAPARPSRPPAGQDRFERQSTYVVQRGDTLEKIAERLLGDKAQWKTIHEANRDLIPDPGKLYPGQVLIIPGMEAPRGSAASYVVRRGDSLKGIAKTMLGDAERWQEIHALNRDRVPDPKQLYPGQVLALPFSTDQLARLGETDKHAFFAALRPAAEEAERHYMVPAAVTLAQAALETGWGKYAIEGYNLFGVKGTGPAGTTSVRTHEYIDGRRVAVTDQFAKYHSVHEAVMEHGRLFHNGYYTKAVDQYYRDRDPRAFARNIQGIYATDPEYARKLIQIMAAYDLV